MSKVRFSIYTIFSFLLPGLSTQATGQTNYAKISSNLLEAVKNDWDTEEFTTKLESADPNQLAASLSDDVHKKTFWINVYNSFIILKLRENPALFEDRGSFFSEPRVTIAGELLSFDNIEHGILRRSKVKLSYGYLGKLFVSSFEKKMRVEEVDWRIHFALNCGAKSCPPVEVYRVATLESQLENRAKQFLEATTVHSVAEGSVEVTTLMNWFRADFGGEKGTIEIIKRFGLIPQDASPSLTFSGYDWTLDIKNFTD